MAKPPDPHRLASARKHYEIAFHSLLREDEVIRHYQSMQYEIVCENDERIRERYGLKGPAADLVVQVNPDRAIVAEVKGKDLDHALKQLIATAGAVRKSYRHVSCKVFSGNPVPSEDRVRLPSGNVSVLGFEAIRIFHRGFPGEWPLLKILDESGRTEFFRIGDEPVSIIFGPFAPKTR